MSGPLGRSGAELGIDVDWRRALAVTGVLGLSALGGLYHRSRRLRRTYERAVQAGLSRAGGDPPTLTRADLDGLPALVRRYVRRSGAVGEPRVRNVRARFDARMRTTPDDDWFDLTMEQYAFFDRPARFLYLHSFPVVGLHEYRTAGGRVDASMRITYGGLYPITDVDGPKMAQSETVTFLNDMALLAPATLVDERVRWETLDDRTVRATFANGDVTVSARLLFDENGDLVNFVSDDRYYIPDENTFREAQWSTPVDRGELVWHLPEGEFTAAQVDVVDVEYNLDDLE